MNEQITTFFHKEEHLPEKTENQHVNIPQSDSLRTDLERNFWEEQYKEKEYVHEEIMIRISPECA
jgi:hypothetical protein